MAYFPVKENDVVALAEQMIAGYTAHPADFPSIDPLTDLVALQAALDAYQADKQTQEDAKSQAQIATVTKTTQLDELAELMKNDLKLSEVDVAANPEKLTEIGWGPKAAPVSISAPNTPSSLVPVFEGDGIVELEWDKPSVDPNRPVGTYIVQRRDQAAGGEFGEWNSVDMVYTHQSRLIGQPTMTRMEYRVIASNPAGQSLPSNTVSVVL